jgi:hypothetical protein
MAEGNANRPAPETLTTEDVDRLSERFKPSWESEPQNAPPPARPALKQTMLGGTAPAAPPAPRVAAPAAPTASPPAGAPAVAPLAPTPMVTVSAGKESLETAKAVMRHPTLVGIAPQAIRQVSGAPQAAPDDLDWELPPGEQPEPPSDMAQTARIVKVSEAAPKAEASRIQQVQPEPPKAAPVVAAPPAAAAAATPARTDADEPMAIDVEELPPKSQPSGIGEKYVPRDVNAPAVVLNDEVARTEAQARAKIEAQHRARSAPTIAKMPAVRAPGPAPVTDFLDEDTVSHRRKGGRGVWVVLALLTLGGGAAAAVALLRKPELPASVTTATSEKPVAADTQAPPPPAVTAAPPPPAPVAAPEPEASAPEPPPKPAKVAAVAPPVEPAAEAPKRPPAPAARPSTKPKPTSTGKAASAPRPSRPSVIVRDNPF